MLVNKKVNKENSPKDKPEENKQYALTGGPGDKCISNGNSWKESEVKEDLNLERFKSLKFKQNGL